MGAYLMTVTTTYVGTINGLDVFEVYKDGDLIGTNVSARDEQDA